MSDLQVVCTSCSKNGDFEIKPCTCQVSNKIFKINMTVLHFNTVYLVNRHLTFNLMRLVVRMCETASNCNSNSSFCMHGVEEVQSVLINRRTILTFSFSGSQSPLFLYFSY